MNDRPRKLNFDEINKVSATCLGMHVRLASRVLTQVYDAAFRSVGLVLNQFTLLVAIHQLEPTPIKSLAQELSTDQTTLTRNLKLLENNGLLKIVPGEDRRIKLVSLTDEGRAILAQAIPLWEQAQTKIMQHFSEQKGQTLLALLSEVKEVKNVQ